MHLAGFLTTTTVVLLLVACGNESPEAEPTATVDSGVRGLVHLGPQCPVETIDEPCEDEPAADVTVTISEQLPGEAYAAGPAVASTTTDAEGRFQLVVGPGDYVVTADAGMSCELMDVRVESGKYTTMDVPCDSGIR